MIIVLRTSHTICMIIFHNRCRSVEEPQSKYGRDYYGCYDSRPGVVDENSRGVSTQDFNSCVKSNCTTGTTTQSCDERVKQAWGSTRDTAKAVAQVKKDCPGDCNSCTAQMFYLTNSVFRAFLARRAALA